MIRSHQNETIIRKPNRLFFVDVIRLLSMVAIAHFHIHEAFFFTNEHQHAQHSYFEMPLVYYSRLMAFSGFSIVIISYFLIGYIGLTAKKLRQLIKISCVGVLVITSVYWSECFDSFEWDIYPFILISSLVLSVISRSNFTLIFFSLTGLIAMALPAEFWIIEPLMNQPYYNALFGSYHIQGLGSWPLIPWLGLPIISYSLGKWVRNSQSLLKKLITFSRSETFLWLPLLIIASFQWGSFLPVPIGSDFYKFVNNQPRLNLFSHLIIVIFCIRLGFVTKVNQWALSNPWLSWISKISLNRKFFLFYILNWLLIGIFSQWSEVYVDRPLLFDFILLTLFPVTEVLCFLVQKSQKRLYRIPEPELRAAP